MTPARKHLRVLVAHSDVERLTSVALVLIVLGHDVLARNVDLASVGALTVAESPDVAMIVVGENSERALGLIDRVVKEAVCPVIALLDVEDPKFVKEAARRGVFAYLSIGETVDLQGSIDIVLCRFAEFHNLEGAFARRAVIEQAKGVLMERHRIGEGAAFELLRSSARGSGRKLEAVADLVMVGSPLPEGIGSPTPGSEG